MGKRFNQKVFISRLSKVTNGCSGKDLATAIGEKPGTVSKWKSEKYGSIPTTEQLLAIAEKYDCSVDYLLGITPHQTSPYTNREICEALVAIDRQIDLKIQTPPADFISQETPVGIEGVPRRTLNINLEYVGDDGIDSRGSQYKSIIEFFEQYNDLRKTPNLPNGVLETCVNAWLDEIDKKEQFVNQIITDLSREAMSKLKAAKESETISDKE